MADFTLVCILKGGSPRSKSLRLVTLNVNGIRSAAAKGFFVWLPKQKADLVCVQELKAQRADLAPELLKPKGYLGGAFHHAIKKGYSGVGIYYKVAPDKVSEGLGIADIDAEGRYLRVDYGRVSVISAYLPSGSAGPERQAVKFKFLEQFLPHLKRLRKEKREIILCGDWNIAHTQIDLKNWRSNQKNSGFLPEERAWLTQVFDELGWVDVFRHIKRDAEQYTWWSNRGQAWAKNVGWRIDYQIATPGIAAKAKAVSIYKAKRFSDHAPLVIDYDVTLT
jgi:exodeoxyribonuclease III